MTRSTIRLVVLASLCLGTSPSARAEFVEWQFSTIVTPTLVSSNNHPLGAVHLTNTTGIVYNTSHIILANLFAVSNAAITAPDTFTNRPFTITLTITDKATNVKGTVHFAGIINGTDSLFSSFLTFTLTSPATEQLHLGQHIYSVHLDNLTPPGPPNSGADGSIGATVTVTHNPEPATLLLAGIGAAGMGLARWRGRRRHDVRPARSASDGYR